MRIAFQINVISRFHGQTEVEKTRHFSIVRAKLTNMDDEEDSREFARCAEKAEEEALRSNGAAYPEWTHSVQEVRWQILP